MVVHERVAQALERAREARAQGRAHLSIGARRHRRGCERREALMDGEGSETLLVFTNLPDREAALKLARGLVERRLAACVNVLDGCTSVYHWKGEVEEATEVPVLVKTRNARYDEL